MNLRRPFPDLPGDWTVKIGAPADYFVRNLEVVLLEQDLGRHGRRAGWLALSPQQFADLEPDGDRLLDALEHSLDRIFRPWRYPDPDWPELVLWRRLRRLERAASARWHRIYWRARFRLRRLTREAKT